MRDLEQVQRAERAATALERAWLHWRARHGLGTGQLPPVSSYVGYSVEEPWGQPRVVFGLEADEAERLAAILDGQDYVGPVHAEVAWADRRRQDTTRSPWNSDGTGAGVPQQAADPDAGGPLGGNGRGSSSGGKARGSDARGSDARGSDDSGSSDTRHGDAPGGNAPGDNGQGSDGRASKDKTADDAMDGARFAAAPLPPPAAKPDDLTAEQPILPAVLRQAAAMADLPAELPPSTAAQLQDLTARPPSRTSLVALRARPVSATNSPAPEVPARPESRPGTRPAATPDSAIRPDSVSCADAASRVDSMSPAESSGAAESSSAAESLGPVRSPGRAESSGPAESTGVLPAHSAPSGRPANGVDPVTRQFEEPAPWWQGTPFEQTAARVAEGADAQSADQVAMARLFPVSRLSRSRKPAPGAPEAGPWPAGERAAAGGD
jgi:hypothetical protein